MRLLLFVDTRFQGLFHPPLGVLFTFPSRYWFTIGHLDILSLGRWSSRIPTGLLVPHGTQVTGQSIFCFVYGGITLFAGPFQVFPLQEIFVTLLDPCKGQCLYLQPFISNACRLALKKFGLVPVRSPLLRESLLISCPAGTKMVQFPAFASHGFTGMTRCGFPHSEILGSTLACQLAEAYRRLLRPSSLPGAKASTVCPYLLDPIHLSSVAFLRTPHPSTTISL